MHFNWTWPNLLVEDRESAAMRPIMGHLWTAHCFRTILCFRGILGQPKCLMDIVANESIQQPYSRPLKRAWPRWAFPRCGWIGPSRIGGIGRPHTKKRQFPLGGRPTAVPKKNGRFQGAKGQQNVPSAGKKRKKGHHKGKFCFAPPGSASVPV